MQFSLFSAAFSVVFGFSLFFPLALLAQDDDPIPAELVPDRLKEVVPTTHVEIESIQIPLGDYGRIETLAMDPAGNLLIATSQFIGDSDYRTYSIEVYDPRRRKSVDWWPMYDVEPKMVHVAEDGKVYVVGWSQMAQLDKNGRLENLVRLSDVLGDDYDEVHPSGLTSNGDFIFLALGTGRSLRATEEVFRFKRNLGDPKLVIRRQYGCCSHIDLDVHDGVLLVAENSRHRVNRFTLDGELIERWGKRDRTGIEGFAACCNPVNFDMGPGDVLYTAESGIGRIKRFSPEGEFLGVVGYVDTTIFDRGSRLAAVSCYIPIEVSKDASHIYVMDVRANVIRVLEEREKVSSLVR